ncbi:MAG: PHP domain-containing protein [Candidatus Aenigmarchaeota archaeon]|nr:PHP domain-containing protein [Candidatus Aenigmarchaeota archaeon]
MKIDCHCHTIYSKHWFWGFDAINTPLEMIKVAIKKGMDGLAITDHDTVKGSLVGKKVAKRFKNFIIITGSEIKTKEGEIIGLDIKENIPINLSIGEAIEKIHDLGGIAVAPHPFGSYVFRKCAQENALKADAIEVYNSTLTKKQNNKALRLAKKFKKSFTAGSDAHSAREVGNAGIIVNGNPIDSILKNKVKIFGRHTSILRIAGTISKKFIRSIEWRITGGRRKYS